MKNVAVAGMFELMADVLELKGENPRIRALPPGRPQSGIAQRRRGDSPRRGRLDEIPGIGRLAGKINPLWASQNS